MTPTIHDDQRRDVDLRPRRGDGQRHVQRARTRRADDVAYGGQEHWFAGSSSTTTYGAGRANADVGTTISVTADGSSKVDGG